MSGGGHTGEAGVALQRVFAVLDTSQTKSLSACSTMREMLKKWSKIGPCAVEEKRKKCHFPLLSFCCKQCFEKKTFFFFFTCPYFGSLKVQIYFNLFKFCGFFKQNEMFFSEFKRFSMSMYQLLSPNCSFASSVSILQTGMFVL